MDTEKDVTTGLTRAHRREFETQQMIERMYAASCNNCYSSSSISQLSSHADEIKKRMHDALMTDEQRDKVRELVVQMKKDCMK